MSAATDPRRAAIRAVLAARLEALAAYRLGRLRGAGLGAIESIEEAHASLASRSARDRLCELRSSGSELDAACDAAMAHHLVRAAGEHAAAEELDAFDAAWTSAIVQSAEQKASAPAALLAARDEPVAARRARWGSDLARTAAAAVAPWLALRAAETDGRSNAAYELEMKRDAERAAIPERARTFLSDSEDLGREALDFLGAARVRGDGIWQVAAAAEAPAERGATESPERRVRRVTAWLSDVGLAERVAGVVRVCPTELPIVRALPLRTTKVALVVGPGAGERLERESMNAVGEAIARALVDVTLPVEVRWPAWPWLARIVGATCERLLAYPAFLLRLVGDTRRADEHARRFALAGVLRLRLAAAAVIAAAEGPRGREAAGEVARSAIERAIGATVAPDVAALWLPRRWRAELDLSARLAALSVERAVIERHDLDFHRNPRTGRTLTALCAAGAMATPETVRDAIGADTSATAAATYVSLLRETGAV